MSLILDRSLLPHTTVHNFIVVLVSQRQSSRTQQTETEETNILGIRETKCYNALKLMNNA